MSRIIRSTKFWPLGGAVAVGLAGTAYATIPGGDGVIHACYAKSGGTLRVIDASVTNCKSGETALNWSQQGQPGPKGDPGEPGPAGPPGEQGEPGHAGGLAGSEAVEVQGVESSVDDKIEAVACPAGKLPVGRGAVAFNDSGTPREVALTASRPTDDGWPASAGEVAPTDEAWHLTVYAVCANAVGGNGSSKSGGAHRRPALASSTNGNDQAHEHDDATELERSRDQLRPPSPLGGTS